MLGLGSIIPIGTALGLVATDIEKQVEHDVFRYDMILKFDTEQLAFNVWNPEKPNEKPIMYDYPHDVVKDAIRDMTIEIMKEQGTTKEQLLYVVIQYNSQNENDNFAIVHYNDETGTKKQFKHIY